MTDQTPRFKLPFMSTSQVQKELTFNELAAMCDCLIQLSVLDVTRTTPPGSPADGDVHLIAASATGAWAGLDYKVAFYIGGWHYADPHDGYLAWSQADGKFYRYIGADHWQPTVVTPIDHLSELLDVNVATPTDKQVLTWDNATSKFILQPVAHAIGDLSDVHTTGVTDGMILKWVAADSRFEVFTNSFLGLSDTPDAYTGQAHHVATVNPTEDGLVFTVIVSVPAGGGTGQVLAKASATDYDLTWITPSTGGGGGGGATALSGLTDVDTTTTAPTDGQALVWNGGVSKWEPATIASGGSALEVLDEGTALDTAVVQINFTGSGVTATASGHNVTVDIPGGGGGGSALAVKDEGTSLTAGATSLNFVGAGVTASASGTDVTVTVPGGGGGGGAGVIAPTAIVQKVASGGTNTGGTLTFGTAATAGNKLIAIYCGGRYPSTPTGFTLIEPHVDNSSQTIYVYYKVSDGTETSFSATSSDNGQWVFYELENCFSFQFVGAGDYFTATPSLRFIPGAQANGALTIIVAEHDGTEALVVTGTGVTTDFPGLTSSNNHVGWIGHATDFEGLLTVHGTTYDRPGALLYLYAYPDQNTANVGGIAGTVSVPNIMWEIMRERTKAHTAGYTSGSTVDKMVAQGDMRGLLFDVYATGSTGSGSPMVSTHAALTVPAGKVAILLVYDRSSQVFTDSTFYKHWIRNTTTSTDYNPILADNNYHGFSMPQGANSTITVPMVIGVAGDSLEMCASSSGDGNSRTVSGFAIIALADAVTFDFDPGTTASVAAGGRSAARVLLSDQTVSSTTAQVTFNEFDPTTYLNYEIEITGLVVDGSTDGLAFTLSSDGGVTFDTGSSYDHAFNIQGSGGYGSGNNINNATSALVCQDLGTAALQTGDVLIRMFDPANTAHYKQFIHDAVVGGGDGNMYQFHGASRWKSTAACNAISLFGRAVNITSGRFRLYGIPIVEGGSNSPSGTRFKLPFFFTNTPASYEVIGMIVADEAFSIPANFAGAQKVITGINPTSAFVITMERNGTSIGTISISTAGVATLATAGGSAITVNVGDVITYNAPAVADATVANVVGMLWGTVL